MKLYIIGNGFDLKHHLPTGYEDFAEFCKLHYESLFTRINNCFPEITKESLWSNFEIGLGFPSEEEMKEYYSKYLQSSNKCDLFLEIQNDLKYAFKDWVVSLKSLTPYLEKYYVFEQNSIFLSFNYTDVLEVVYKESNESICHIHLSANKTEEQYFTGYIFGHGKDEMHSHDNIDSFDYLSKDFINGFKKEYQTNELKRFINGKEINEIHVIGHSMNIIDDPYFMIINSAFPDAQWHIEYHGEDDYNRKLKNISRIGINKPDLIKS